MRKLFNLFGITPASLKRVGEKVLKVTTAIARGLDSDVAKFITGIIPGNQDEVLRTALLAVLKKFNEDLKKAETEATRKAILLRIGAEALYAMDGRKEPFGYYVILMQKIYDGSI